MPYYSTKTWDHNCGLSAAFRQYKAGSHCKYLHGYALAITVKFGAIDLDARNWVVDFGGLKDFKQLLVENFDHRTVVAENDPEIEWFREAERRGILSLNVLPAVGCEAFARMIFDTFSCLLVSHGFAEEIDANKRMELNLSFDNEPSSTGKNNAVVPRVWVESVEVREHGANSAIYARPTADRLMHTQHDMNGVINVKFN